MIIPTELPPHPRMLASASDWDRLRRQSQADQPSTAFWRALSDRADQLLHLPVLTREMTGRRLLAVSREALERISVLSLVACVGGEVRHLQRAKEEMLGLARFEDWNPSHFLDVAEAALALSIGYDWLFQALTEAERIEIGAALVDKALLPSLDASASHNWWQGAAENWAQVCHGGLCAAAIAVAEDHPELANRILRRALEQVPGAAVQYEPDGVYPEGPMYWTYGTSFHVVLCAALLRLTGSTHGLAEVGGLEHSAAFMTEVTGPSGRFFNFGDCTDRRRLQVPLFWIAQYFGRGEWLRHDLEHLADELAAYSREPNLEYGHYRMLALAWLWHDPTLAPTPRRPPQSWCGRGSVPLAVLRHGSTYVAVKGGSAAISHAHMDAGSFVMEMDGVRWAVDPGMQDYNSLESAGIDLWNHAQNSTRWTVFRIGPEAHNILRFDGAPQLVTGQATLEAFDNGREAPRAVLDLSAVYPEARGSVRRGIGLVGDGAVLFQDEWTAGAEVGVVTWQFLTEADVTQSARDIHLHQSGSRLILRILGPEDAAVRVVDASRPAHPFDAANPRFSKLVVETSARSGRLRVLATRNPQTPSPSFVPLSDW